jgi:hypothetical protein
MKKNWQAGGVRNMDDIDAIEKDKKDLANFFKVDRLVYFPASFRPFARVRRQIIRMVDELCSFTEYDRSYTFKLSITTNREYEDDVKAGNS